MLKKGKRNKLSYRSANKSVFVQNFRPFVSLPLERLSSIAEELLEGKQIMVVKKMHSVV